MAGLVELVWLMQCWAAPARAHDAAPPAIVVPLTLTLLRERQPNTQIALCSCLATISAGGSLLVSISCL